MSILLFFFLCVCDVRGLTSSESEWREGLSVISGVVSVCVPMPLTAPLWSLYLLGDKQDDVCALSASSSWPWQRSVMHFGWRRVPLFYFMVNINPRDPYWPCCLHNVQGRSFHFTELLFPPSLISAQTHFQETLWKGVGGNVLKTSAPFLISVFFWVRAMGMIRRNGNLIFSLSCNAK